jgi:hypothetical protein
MHTLLLLAVLALGGAEVYRWVDADGVVHYSDRPHPGAERVIIQAAPTSGNLAVPSRSSRREPENPEAAGTGYELSIQSPTQDEVLWNIEGQLEVAAAVEPSLRPGHQLQVILDGRPVTTLPPGITRTRLSEVYRGTHTVAVEVLDESGNSLVRSPAVPFVVRQTSIQNPVNPITPPTP